MGCQLEPGKPVSMKRIFKEEMLYELRLCLQSPKTLEKCPNTLQCLVINENVYFHNVLVCVLNKVNKVCLIINI